MPNEHLYTLVDVMQALPWDYLELGFSDKDAYERCKPQLRGICHVLRHHGIERIVDLVGKTAHDLDKLSGMEEYDEAAALQDALTQAGYEPYLWHEMPFAMPTDAPLARAYRLNELFTDDGDVTVARNMLLEARPKRVITSAQRLQVPLTSYGTTSLCAIINAEPDAILEARAVLASARGNRHPLLLYGALRERTPAMTSLPSDGRHWYLDVAELGYRGITLKCSSSPPAFSRPAMTRSSRN